MSDKIPVMEVFGPTIQGEGMVIGQKTMFVRTAGCDYQCAWCDSAFTWDGSERDKTRWMTPKDVLDELFKLGQGRFHHVTISGGNPALIGAPMKHFIELCHEANLQVGLETQGSKVQDWFFQIDDLTLSPKPPSSGMKPDLKALDELVDALLEEKVHFSLKVVVFDAADIDFARRLFGRYDEVAKYLQVGDDRPRDPGDVSGHLLTRLKWLFEQVIADPGLNDVRVLPQLHALVWSNERAK